MSFAIVLKPGADTEGFRMALRRLIAADVPPENIFWDFASQLFSQCSHEPGPPLLLPRQVVK
jgi:DNA polymerase